MRNTRRVGYIARVAAVTVALALSISLASQAQGAGAAKGFFKSLVGEWIGTCQQSTDGQQAENKYFHGVIKQVNDTTFTSRFDYYRQDPRTGGPLPIGESNITTTIAPDGTVNNKITGKGTMMVNKQPKNQEHELNEVLSGATSACLQGTGGGSLKVYGMPLGLGKNGKISNGKSTWSLSNGVLSINQNLTASFRALFVKKSFAFAAQYTARRGSNVASIMTGPSRVSYKP